MKKFTVILIIALLALSVLLLPACGKNDTDDEDGGDTIPPRTELTVVTYNIRTISIIPNGEADKWDNRKDALVAHIHQYMPDIVGMQEVWGAQRKYLSDGLPEYSYIGRSREAGLGDTLEGVYIFYRTDRLELLNYEYYWLSETPDVASRAVEWGAGSTRIAILATFKDLNTGKTFFHFNTHLDNVSHEARTKGLRMALDTIQEKNLPSILTGDFNFEEGTANYNVAAGEMDDVKYLTENNMLNTGTYHGYTNLQRTKPIDFIFVSKDMFEVFEYKILNETVDGVYTSDHYAVLAEIKQK